MIASRSKVNLLPVWKSGESSILLIEEGGKGLEIRAQNTTLQRGRRWMVEVVVAEE